MKVLLYGYVKEVSFELDMEVQPWYLVQNKINDRKVKRQNLKR